MQPDFGYRIRMLHRSVASASGEPDALFAVRGGRFVTTVNRINSGIKYKYLYNQMYIFLHVAIKWIPPNRIYDRDRDIGKPTEVYVYAQ